jgi:hypothetical protein
MTGFLDDHPGGREIIYNNRSKDVSFIFRPRHPSDQLEEDNLPPSVHWLGRLDTESASEEEKEELRLKVSKEEEDEEVRIKREREAMEQRGLGVIINMRDFEVGLLDSYVDVQAESAEIRRADAVKGRFGVLCIGWGRRDQLVIRLPPQPLLMPLQPRSPTPTPTRRFSSGRGSFAR